jgi:hypothetical protein
MESISLITKGPKFSLSEMALRKLTAAVHSNGFEVRGLNTGELYTVRRRLHMGAAIFVAIFFALFVAIVLPLIMSGKQWRAEQERARARRMAEHRMNARLLRLNI